jgi:hypothetical protein
MLNRILDWADERDNFLARAIRRVEDVSIWFGQSDAHSWWSHYLILLLGTAALWPLFSFWGGAVLLVIYWGREVYQIAKRPRNVAKWYDDLPDFISALLGYLQVVGLIL